MTPRLPAPPGTRDDDRLAVFVRGATVGAFVGAVIAGSAMWRRIRRPDASRPAGTAPRSRDARPAEEAGPRRS